MKILTVDDSMTARLIVKKAMQAEGHEVLEAADGAVAIQVLDSQAATDAPIDVIFLDWNMPVMNGLDCLKKVRSMKEHSAVKVIMCTTEAEKGSIMQAIQAGANGYALKPVTPETLVQQLNKVVGATT